MWGQSPGLGPLPWGRAAPPWLPAGERACFLSRALSSFLSLPSLSSLFSFPSFLSVSPSLSLSLPFLLSFLPTFLFVSLFFLSFLLSFLFYTFFFFLYTAFVYLFWLSRVLFAACGIFIAACRLLVVAWGLLSCHMWTFSCGMWDLVPRPGIEPRPLALGTWSLTHWTTTEVPVCLFLFSLPPSSPFPSFLPFLSSHAACGILVPQPGVEPGPRQ